MAPCPPRPPAPACASSFLGNQSPGASLGMMLQCLVAWGEGNTPGRIHGQQVLPSEATGLVLRNHLGLQTSATTDGLQQHSERAVLMAVVLQWSRGKLSTVSAETRFTSN